jgi:DNA-binding transcriptional LysR family regulator
MNNIHYKTHVDLGHFHSLDMNLYPMFLAIYEHKSISKASQILCISQSAVSHALQRLRQNSKDDLFVRANGQMLPTPFAEHIYPTVKNALSAIQSISKQNQNFEPSMLKALKIAVHDEIEPMIFPKLVHHFQKLNLDIQFLSSKLDRKTILADLASQQIDFVIDLERHFDEKIEFTPLMQDHFVACTQLEHLNEELYKSSPHIGVSSRRTGILVEDIYLNKKKLNRDVFLRCQHYSTALQILEQYPKAILTIPYHVLTHLQLPNSLNIFDVPVKLPKLNMGMYWHKDLIENSRHIFLRFEIESIFA